MSMFHTTFQSKQSYYLWSFLLFSISLIVISSLLFFEYWFPHSLFAASYTINCSGTAASPTSVTESTYTASDNVTFTDAGGDGYCAIDEAFVANTVTVETGVVITHPIQDVDGVYFTVDSFTLDSGATINVDAKGCPGGGYGVAAASGTSGENGYGQNGASASGACTIGQAGYGPGGSTTAGGGAYGGPGGAGTPLLGVSGGTLQGTEISPQTNLLLGSGGGRDNQYGTGGSGGGKVRIIATGTVTIHGAITADGAAGAGVGGFTGGGGSGGGIYIDADIFAGSGTLSVDGAAGYVWTHTAGNGSGGRIFLEYNTRTFSNLNGITFAGATNGSTPAAGNGSLLLLDQSASSYVFLCSGNSNVPQPMSESAYLVTDDISFEASGGGYCELDGLLRVNDISIASGVTLTHPSSSATGIQIEATGDLTISAGASLNVIGKGCRGGFGTSPYHGQGPDSSNSNVCGYQKAGAATFGSNGASGAGYASRGGKGSEDLAATREGSSYGSATTPQLLGSGGAQASNPGYGGDGGGYIFLSVTGTLAINGSILANGQAGVASTYAGGGGSGGSVYVLAGAIEGSGLLSSNGGNGANDTSYDGGGGSGGRVSLNYCTVSIDSMTTSTSGGIGPDTATDGGAGSWYTAVRSSGCNEIPFAGDPALTAYTDGTGAVTLLTTITDVDADDVSLRIEHKEGSCSEYTDFSSTTLSSSVSATYGSPDIDNNNINGFQVSSVVTSDSNTVSATWLSQLDEPSANGTYCVFVTPYDGTNYGTVASSTVVLDNVHPTTPDMLMVDTTSTESIILTFPTPILDTNFREYKIFYKEGSAGVTEQDTAFTSTSDANLGSRTFAGATTTTIPGLSSNTQYVFTLVAYDTFGNTSTPVSELAVYTLAEQVTDLAIQDATNTSTLQLEFSWTNNGQTGMNIDRDNGCDSSYDVVIYDDAEANEGSPFITDDGLSPNTCYVYRIQSYNAFGELNTVQAPTTTQIITPPAQPQSVTAALVDETQIVWSWDAVTGADSYEVYSSPTGTLLATIAAPIIQFSNTALSANTSYAVVVRAVSAYGTGIASTEASTVTDASVPDGLSHTNQQTNSIRFTWNNGGQSSFLARDKQSIGNNSGVITDSYWDYTGLSANTAYTVEVRGSNSLGEATAFAELTRYSSQQDPEGILFSSIGSSQLTITADGTFPNNGVGSSVLRFVNTTLGTVQDVDDDEQWTQTGLSPNVPYIYTVTAFNGDGDQTTTVTSSPQYTLAATPGTPIVAAGTTSTLFLTIDPNGNSSSTVFAVYNETAGVYIGADGAASASAIYQTTSTWGSSITLRGLTENTAYQFSVLAKNADAVVTATSTPSTAVFTESSGDFFIADEDAETFDQEHTILIIDGDPGDGTGSLSSVVVGNDVSEDQNVALDFQRVIHNRSVQFGSSFSFTRSSTKGTISLTIPQNTIVSSEQDDWDGSFMLPTVRTTGSVVVPNGQAEQVIEVGFSGGTLLFDRPVRIVFPGQAGKALAYSRNGGVPQVITLVCDSPTDPANIIGNGACKSTVGSDLILWTKHFTSFFTYVSSGGASFFQTVVPPRVTKDISSGDSAPVDPFRINTGEKTTTNRVVTLQFNMSFVDQMAISESPNFDGASFVLYRPTYTFTLSPQSGSKTIYVRFRNITGGQVDAFDTITLLDASLHDPASLLPDEFQNDGVDIGDDVSSVVCPVEVEQPYQIPNERGVYYVDASCERYPIASPSLYFSYFSSWDDIHAISEVELMNIPLSSSLLPWGPRIPLRDGDVIKSLFDPKVYLVRQMTKSWIISESVFTILGFSWQDIKDVATKVLDIYEDASPIDETTRIR